LLLLSYPLHAPGKPAQLRTAHFPKLNTPVLFVHGTRDPFGSLDEMRTAIQMIPAPVKLIEVEGGGHDLGRDHAALARRIVDQWELMRR
jgi:predicted alpha/beta-hydrolase family hydrolase